MLELIAGWEPREAIGYAVCAFSAIRRTSQPIRFVPLMEHVLRYNGLYTRPHEIRDGQLYDTLSNAPMSTQFANSRFLTPWLASEDSDWVLFCDFADMLFLTDPAELFQLANPSYAVMVVKHRHEPTEQEKMDGQQQTSYQCKNWSSLILWNLRHHANHLLTREMVNTLPGRELHRFCWLKPHQIGALPLEWNYLVGVCPDEPEQPPKLLHYTRGLPTMAGYEDGPFAEEWKKEFHIHDATRGRL